jgi:hypothetical protein
VRAAAKALEACFTAIYQSSKPTSNRTTESPVILKDDVTNTHSIEAAAVSPLVDAAVKSTAELNKPTGPLNWEAWVDIEYGRNVLEDRPLPALMKDGSAPVTQDQHLSPRPLEDLTNGQNDGDTQCTPEEIGANTLPQLLDEGGQKCEALSFPLPQCHSLEPTYEQTDQQQDQGGTNRGVLKEPKDSSPHRSRAEEDKPPEQQREEDTVEEFEGGGSIHGRAESVNSPCQEDREEAGDDAHLSECNSSSRNTNDEIDEDDEGDEEPRPAKRRKRDSQDTRQSQTPVEVGHHISQTSRGPSAIQESVPIAEHQEWPFQGFLKRTRIGTEIMYNLEFKLPCISERLHLPVSVEALGTACTQDMPPTPIARHQVPSQSKICTLPLGPRTRLGWIPEDDRRLIDMKKNGCMWKEIHAAFPGRTLGTIQVRCSTKLKSRITEK